MISSSDILNASVLVVDDLEANVLLLERMLRGAGDAVTSAITASVTLLMKSTLTSTAYISSRYACTSRTGRGSNDGNTFTK